MKKKDLVTHKKFPNEIFRIVSPPENNGGILVIVERFDRNDLSFIILKDHPENFNLV